MDKAKLLDKFLSLKDFLKTSKQVYEKDLDTYTFYNKNDLKDFKDKKENCIEINPMEINVLAYLANYD